MSLRFLRINDDDRHLERADGVVLRGLRRDLAQVPFPHTFYAGYTNGTFAYSPTGEEFVPAVTSRPPLLHRAAAGHLIAAVNRHLREIHAQ